MYLTFAAVLTSHFVCPSPRSMPHPLYTPSFHGTPDTMAGWHHPVAHLPFMEHLTQWQADIFLWHTFLSWNTKHESRLTLFCFTPSFSETPNRMAGWLILCHMQPFVEHLTFLQVDFVFCHTLLSWNTGHDDKLTSLSHFLSWNICHDRLASFPVTLPFLEHTTGWQCDFILCHTFDGTPDRTAGWLHSVPHLSGNTWQSVKLISFFATPFMDYCQDGSLAPFCATPFMEHPTGL